MSLCDIRRFRIKICLVLDLLHATDFMLYQSVESLINEKIAKPGVLTIYQ
jgi:hypothetical protein